MCKCIIQIRMLAWNTITIITTNIIIIFIMHEGARPPEAIRRQSHECTWGKKSITQVPTKSITQVHTKSITQEPINTIHACNSLILVLAAQVDDGLSR